MSPTSQRRRTYSKQQQQYFPLLPKPPTPQTPKPIENVWNQIRETNTQAKTEENIPENIVNLISTNIKIATDTLTSYTDKKLSELTEKMLQFVITMQYNTIKTKNQTTPKKNVANSTAKKTLNRKLQIVSTNNHINIFTMVRGDEGT